MLRWLEKFRRCVRASPFTPDSGDLSIRKAGNCRLFCDRVYIAEVTEVCHLVRMKPTRDDIPETAEAVAALDQEDVSAATQVYQRQLERAMKNRDYERMVRVGQILVQLGRSRSDFNSESVKAGKARADLAADPSRPTVTPKSS